MFDRRTGASSSGDKIKVCLICSPSPRARVCSVFPDLLLSVHITDAKQASLSRPLHSDRRKLIPVAQALADMKAVSERTAAGDLAGKRKTRSGKQAVQ
ncbi:unnamed protein product [Scytosiphon promiscuus]